VRLEVEQRLGAAGRRRKLRLGRLRRERVVGLGWRRARAMVACAAEAGCEVGMQLLRQARAQAVVGASWPGVAWRRQVVGGAVRVAAREDARWRRPGRASTVA
jgi:hypothetical protein